MDTVRADAAAAGLSAEVRAIGIAGLEVHRKRVYRASQQWIALRDKYREHASVLLARFDPVSAAHAMTIAENAEMFRLDCVRVYHFLYEFGFAVFGEGVEALGLLAALPALPVVAVVGVIGSIAALIGWLEWLDYQGEQLKATLEADKRRIDHTENNLRVANDPNSTPIGRAAAAQVAVTTGAATARGTPHLNKKSGFLDKLMGDPVLLAAVGFAAFKWGPDLVGRR